MTFVLTCYKYAGLIGAMILPDAETTLKLKAAVESLGGEYKANVQVLGDATADHASQDTIEKVNAWLAENGFDAVSSESLKAK